MTENKKTRSVPEQVEHEAKADLVSQFTGMLSALLPLLAILGISLDWFTQEFIDNLYVFLVALIPFVINLYTIYKNHFTGEHAKEQNRALKEKGLK